MELNDLLKFIEIESRRLQDYYPGLDKEKHILARAVKLSEELGELSNEVLAHSSLQRKKKLEDHNPDKLGEEFADVVITAMLLAKIMGVEIEKSIEKKMGKINSRYEQAI